MQESLITIEEMSEIDEKDQDQVEDGETVNFLAEPGAEEIDSQKALDDIDQLLTEEDPEFLEQISHIKIDAAAVNLSILDDVVNVIDTVGTVNKNSTRRFNLRFHLQNLFQVNHDPKKFVIFWGLIVVALGIIFFGVRFSDRFLSQGLFLRSYAEWDLPVHSYNPMSEVELFYDNPRFAKNLMTMSKMFVNLKSSESSGPNPMLAIEINVEGMSAEAIIEIKDREAEFKDILLRQAEDFTYDDLVSVEGKKSLLQKFQMSLNANLTQGQVRRAMLKSFIIKP